MSFLDPWPSYAQPSLAWEGGGGAYVDKEKGGGGNRSATISKKLSKCINKYGDYILLIYIYL